ncbi:DUF6457 domain-containing protein [Microlunatus sp. GCM10028923]|uniref:DUF6457 domain-containing protein n=1 Tax=Microlunatus sp. GCM10028923 TaxID=3273400 RepID=UPI00360AAD48
MDRDEWLAALSAQIGTEDIPMDDDAMHIVLDLARDAAHEVERPAAPLTAFLVGVAVGRGAALGAVAAQATELILSETGSAEPGPAAATEDGPAGV